MFQYEASGDPLRERKAGGRPESDARSPRPRGISRGAVEFV